MSYCGVIYLRTFVVQEKLVNAPQCDELSRYFPLYNRLAAGLTSGLENQCNVR